MRKKIKDLPTAFTLKPGIYYHNIYDDLVEITKEVIHECKKCDEIKIAVIAKFVTMPERNFKSTYSKRFPGIFGYKDPLIEY